MRKLRPEASADCHEDGVVAIVMETTREGEDNGKRRKDVRYVKKIKEKRKEEEDEEEEDKEEEKEKEGGEVKEDKEDGRYENKLKNDGKTHEERRGESQEKWRRKGDNSHHHHHNNIWMGGSESSLYNNPALYSSLMCTPSLTVPLPLPSHHTTRTTSVSSTSSISTLIISSPTTSIPSSTFVSTSSSTPTTTFVTIPSFSSPTLAFSNTTPVSSPTSLLQVPFAPFSSPQGRLTVSLPSSPELKRRQRLTTDYPDHQLPLKRIGRRLHHLRHWTKLDAWS
ncbi:hypothetical protein Pcinc_020830 [Petrolisthes cinctipes]|uniref:Uncharacterized protein n=1 Tax=Petrolisthes cinctipes TaxID=88211 RepID=A0AAE1FLN0_PETCI|nr:hypothetical protein Pcinc_020830 [Petrolisthes cinctipes]